MGNFCVFPSKLDKKSILDTTQVSYMEEPYFKNEAERIEIQSDSDSVSNRKITLSDFIKIKVLGIGAFGRVVLVKKRDSNDYYAMKILKKSFIESKNQTENAQTERKILEKMHCPYIVQLHSAFQSKKSLYYVMDFMQGGELFYHLKNAYRFSEEKTKFFAAEIVIALEYLHSKNIIYRDLKPENVLLGIDGHIKLTDFGLSKIGVQRDAKTYSLCGTPGYLAPEIFQQEGHNRTADWWSLGALMYEMLTGMPPFYSNDQTTMFTKILTKPIEMKSHFSTEARSVLRDLLQVNPVERLGALNVLEIKNHAFFEGINWNLLEEKKIESKFKLKTKGKIDLQHFDINFTNESLKDSIENQSESKNDRHYAGFSFYKKIQKQEKGK